MHILHHAGESPIVGNWMLEELREHGYQVSPGTLYPMLARLCRIGWLKRIEEKASAANPKSIRYTLTKAGRHALDEVRARLRELQGEVFKDADASRR